MQSWLRNLPFLDGMAREELPRRRISAMLVEQRRNEVDLVRDLIDQGKAAEISLEVVHDLRQALGRLQHGGIDVALLGAEMADGVATNALRSLRSDAPEVPVIVLTSFPAERLGRQALLDGAQDCVRLQNVTPAALHRIVEYAIERHQIQSQQIDELWSAQILYQDFLTIVRSSSDGIVVVDDAGVVLFMNPYAESLFGYEPDVAIGEPFAADVTPGQTTEIDVTSDRGVARVEIRTVTTGWKGGSAHLALLRDITERRALEQQLAQAQKLESVGQLSAGIAHEINTPIQFISDNTRFLQRAFERLIGVSDSYRELLAEAKTDSVPQAAIERVEAAEGATVAKAMREEMTEAFVDSLDGLDQVSRIVHAMRSFSHPASNERAECDLNKVVESAIAISRNEWKDVAEIETALDADLPPVAAVPGDLNQVTLNLITNAAHAIAESERRGEGRGTITVTTRQDEQWVEIGVSDTGDGIAEAIRHRVFDPFFTTKAVGQGTGQGLAISRALIVDRNRGTLDFETVAGMGTTFVVRLPLTDQMQQQRPLAA